MKIQRTGSNLSAWLALIRLPNLLTVPGDPMAGFLLASAAGVSGVCGALVPDAGRSGGWSAAAAAVMVSLLLYMHGLIENDLLDLREDRLLRPQRPLPSGKVGIRAASIVCFLLAVAGIAVAGVIGRQGMWLAAALTATVFCYHAVLKHHRLLGPLSMGLCRALSLLLGAAATAAGTWAAPPVLAAAALLGLYVAAVTSVAAQETLATVLGARRWGPALVLVAGFTLIGWTGWDAGLTSWPYALVFGWPMALWAGWIGRRLAGTVSPDRIQASVVCWLRGFLYLQFVLVAIGWQRILAPGIIFLLAWLLHGRLARRYACT